MYTIVCSLFCLTSSLTAQQNINNGPNPDNSTQLGTKEYVYVHQNTAVALVGEYLFYKVYCVDAGKNKLSIGSKFAFVTLVNEDKEPVFTHKVKLDDSQGQGDYFIPENVPSGNYKLVGYTQIMKQQGTQSFFSSDLSIINPYQQQNRSFVSSDASDINVAAKVVDRQISEEKAQQQLRSQNLAINTNETVFGPREKVTLKVAAFGTNAQKGAYSVSVKRLDFADAIPPVLSKDYQPTFSGQNARPLSANSNFLTKVQGDYISGKVMAKNGASNIKDVQVGMSVLGREFNIKLAITDADGAFYFNLAEDYDGQEAAFQVMEDFEKNYTITFDPPTQVDYSFLDFGNFKIGANAKERILSRSVHNQIENAYFKVRPDTVLVPPTIKPFYGIKRGVSYLLDDYTRFNTTTETLTEIIEDAYRRKRKGTFFVGVRTLEDVFPESTPALLLIDDVMVQDHQLFFDMSSRSIESMTVVRDNYAFGGKEYRGILVVKTLKGDFHKRYDQVELTDIKMVPTLENKQYFTQKYETVTERAKRIPDYRSQLLWHPQLTLKAKVETIEFYTSDALGVYEVRLEGFKKDGTGVSLVQYIQVE